jgi:trimeric autotransporter adhesin
MAANKGSNNIGIGALVLYYNTTGSNNIAIGNSAGGFLSTGDNNIDIGSGGEAAEANTIRIGSTGTQTATYLAGVQGVAVTGAQVVVNTSGQLGVKASSARFKEAIKPMDKASEAILGLHPVSFRYKKGLDPKGEPQFGLVAEEVAKVAPELVARDDQGHPFSVRYEEVNAMLLNEFLKEHKKVEEQDAKITRLETALNEQAAQIQKVTALVKARDPKDRLVDNR